jgi:hypothetical protein
MEDTLIPIRTMDELKKVLFIQKTVSSRAKAEMLALAGDGETPINPEKFFADMRRLVNKYASYPTLTEMKDNPQIANEMKWGSTFGVAVLVGGLVLDEAKQQHPHFDSVIRQMFVKLLVEMNSPKHKYLVEPLEEAIKVKITTVNGKPVTEEQARQYVKQIIHDLVATFVGLGVKFGLMTAKDGTINITLLGRRVLLHLIDAQRFIEEMGRAHGRFQAVKPRLSMT